jgi:hypothetical protein
LTRYSIRKLDGEYVVFADGRSVLKTASRRKAAKLVTEAVELLSVQSAPAVEDGEPVDQSPVISAKFLDDSARFP